MRGPSVSRLFRAGSRTSPRGRGGAGGDERAVPRGRGGAAELAGGAAGAGAGGDGGLAGGLPLPARPARTQRLALRFPARRAPGGLVLQDVRNSPEPRAEKRGGGARAGPRFYNTHFSKPVPMPPDPACRPPLPLAPPIRQGLARLASPPRTTEGVHFWRPARHPRGP